MVFIKILHLVVVCADLALTIAEKRRNRYI